MMIKQAKFLFSALLIFLFLTKSHVFAGWIVDSQGQLVYQNEKGEVLGVVFAKEGKEDDDKDRSSSNSGPTTSTSGSSGDSGKSSSSVTTSTGGTTTGVTPSSTTTQKEEDEEDGEEMEISPTGGVRIKQEEGKTEIKFGEGEKIKVKTKEGEIKTEIVSGGVKVKLERKDGRLKIKAENEAGEELELGEEEIFKIEERIDKNIVKVATGEGEKMVFGRGNVAAATNFPLSVDLTTNSLVVKTPSGTKTVAVLPDAAVNNLLAANVIDKLGAAALTAATASGGLSGVSSIIQFGERNGVAVYDVAGEKQERLFGLIPVSIRKTVTVSAETGELVGQNKTLLNTLLDAFSF